MFITPVYKGIEYKDYLIDENGNVINRKTGNKVKPWLINSGYYVLNLYNNSNSTRMLLHRLMVNSFIGEIPEKMTVNHIDGNKLNNNIKNLEIVSFTENIHHAVRTGLMSSGEDNYNSKYTNEQIHGVCKLLESAKHSISEISKLTGVSKNRISQIFAREKWKKISKDYDFSKKIPVGGDIKKEPFSLRERLMIYKLWELGYSNKEIACIMHYPKEQRFYAAMWDLSRSVRRKEETEKFNDYPKGFVGIKRSEDLPIVQLAKKKGLDRYNNPKQKE